MLIIAAMVFRRRHPQRSTGFLRRFTLILALACQVAAGALAASDTPSSTMQAELRAAMVLCLGQSHPAKPGTPPSHHAMPDQVLAGAMHGFAHAIAVLDNPAWPPPRCVALGFWTGLPEATGPPRKFAASAYPTGPPALI